MSEIPDDVMAMAAEYFIDLQVAGYIGDHTDEGPGAHIIARAILAERKRCADWCDQVAFNEWEQGEVAAQRALNKARDCILSGDDV